MANIVSTGQITITDLHDAIALNAWITASQTTRQTYNNTTAAWSPNYQSSAQVLTLNLTKSGGSGTNLVGSNLTGVKWYKTIGTTRTEITSTTNTDAEYKSGTASSVLTTKTNVPIANNAIIWEVEGTYTDQDTGLPVAVRATIDITLIQLAKAAVISNLYAPNGDTFRNNTPANLKAQADLYKDGALSTGSKKIKWFAADTSVTTSQDTDGGVGWRKITTTTGTTKETVNVGFDTATTTQGILTVYPDAVANAQTYKVVITDNVGGTSGQKTQGYITIRDMDDNIFLSVESTNGTVFKNGVGSTTLTARLFQNGQEIDTAGTKYTYKWTKWENNTMSPNFGGTGVSFKSGKTLTVGSNDVNATSTFRCEIEE